MLSRVYVHTHNGFVPSIISLHVMRDGVPQLVSTAPFRTGTAVHVLFFFTSRRFFCGLFRDHGLDFGKMRVVVATSGIKILLYVSTANLGLFGAVCFATRAINSH